MNIMNIIKKIIRKLVNSFGIDIVKLEKPSGLDNPYCQYSKVKGNIIDVEMLGKMSLKGLSSLKRIRLIVLNSR